MTSRRYKLPGLQVPVGVNAGVQQFYDAVKERLELLSGERGDPTARSATAGELNTASNTSRAASTSAATSTAASTLDITALPAVNLRAVSRDSNLLVQGAAVASQQKMRVGDLFDVFGRTDAEVTASYTWTFANETVTADFSGTAPRFRFVEIPLGDGVEDVLPTNSAIWDVRVNSGVMYIRVRTDADDGGNDVLRIGRTGTTVDYLNVVATALEHNSVQVVTAATSGIDKSGATVSLNTAYVTELAQDAVGAALADTASINFTYTDASNQITADVLPSGVDHGALANLTVGDPHTQYAKRLNSVLTPPQITANQNDYSPTGLATATLVRLSSDAARDITGMTTYEGPVVNVGAFNITLKREDAASAAANRFAVPADLVIPPDGAVWLWPDGTTGRLRCLAKNF